MNGSGPASAPPTPWELLVGRRVDGDSAADSTAEEHFPAFVSATLAEHVRAVAGAELHAQVSTFSCPDPHDGWHATGASLDGGARAVIFESYRRAPAPRASWVIGGSRRVAARHVGGADVPGGRASLGLLIGTYPLDTPDDVVAGHLRAVAKDILAGARLARRLGDATALSHLASTLARAGTRAQALERMGLVLRERTRSAHAKVYVSRWHDGRRQIQRMLRTDRPTDAPRTYPMRSDLGFADWVLREQGWLLISEITLGEEAPDRGLSARGEVDVRGRPSLMLDPDGAIRDDERSLLLVPMHSDGEVLGVLSVWRETPDLYDPDLDRQSLEYFAQVVLSACRWRVEADANQHGADSVRDLEAVLRRGPAPGELYRAFTERGVTLASAFAGALYLRDAALRDVAYPLAVVAEGEAAAAGEALANLAPAPAADFQAALRDALSARVVGSEVALRSVEVFEVHGGEAALALFDRRDGGDRRTLDEGAIKASVRSFVEQGGAVAFDRGESALVHLAAEGIASALIDVDHADPPADPEAQIEDAVQRTARLVYDRTTCDAVLVYRREHTRLHVLGSWPEVPAVKGKAASGLALAALGRAEVSYRLDAEADPATQAELASSGLPAALGWAGVRSWLAVPVVVAGRPVGVVKLLTRAGGRYIDRATVRVVRAITARVGVELVRWSRYQRLSTLNAVASGLAAEGPGRFEATVAARLDVWAQRCIDPSAHVLVIASIDGVRLKVFSSCPDLRADVFQAENDAWLQALLARWKSDPAAAPDTRALSLGAVSEAGAGAVGALVERVPLPAGRGVAAWLLIFSAHPFTPEDAASAREAARELTIFFDHERQRYLWSLELARYRHAVIGPAQGLTTAARMLHRLARDAGAEPAAVARFGRMVEREATSIRLWRENQRLYAGGAVKIVPRRNELRPILDACCGRFREVLLDRGIELKTRWLCPQQLVFEFDADAVDLVLSNLVDNARKYAFYNTTVTIEVKLLDGHMVQIAVEDVGHEIPERLREEVYRVGQRLDWRDPIRAIEGTGLGLPMARALVEKHGGTLTHESRPLGAAQGVARSLVRFLVTLPRRATG